jgi:hypothetical protein
MLGAVLGSRGEDGQRAEIGCDDRRLRRQRDIVATTFVKIGEYDFYVFL